MQRREKLFAIALAASFLVALAIPRFEGFFLEPLDSRRAEIESLDRRLEEKRAERLRIRRIRNKLVDWKKQSLPPHVLDAQRVYKQWLTDLAECCGFTQLQVTSTRRSGARGAFTPVQVTVNAKATFDQLCRFLWQFHETDLLHRLQEIHVDGADKGAKGPLTVRLTTEGLSLTTAAPRDSLFPETTLAKDVATANESLHVTESPEFPLEPGVGLRIGKEFLTVTEGSGTEWAVARGVDATKAADYQAGATVELVRKRSPQRETGFAHFDPLVADSPFVKPEVDKERSLTLEPIAEQKVFIGRQLAFAAKAPDVYRPKQKLKFTLEKGAPKGAKIDANSGAFTWKPDASTKPAKVECTIKVVDGSLKDQTATLKVKIAVTEDVAAKTFLVTILAGDRRVAWLHDRSKNKTALLAVGSEISVNDVKAKVLEIHDKHIVVETNGVRLPVKLGSSVRSIKDDAAKSES